MGVILFLCSFVCFDKAKIIAVIQKTDRKIYYTDGLGYKAPAINKQLTSKADALRIVQNASMLDCSAKQDGIYLNTYSASDMW